MLSRRRISNTSAAADLAVSATAILAGSGVALVSSLVLRVLLARSLDPGQLGSLLFAISAISFAGGVASLGLRQASARRVAALRAAGRPRAAAAAGRTALLLAVTAGGAVTAGAVVASRWPLVLGGKLPPSLLAAVAPVALGLAVGAATWGVSQGHDDTRGRALVRDTGGGLLRLLCVGSAVWAGGGALAIALAWALGSVLAEGGFVAYGASSGWLRRPRPRWDRGLVSSLPPFAGATAINQTRTWLDMLLLGALAPLPVVGLYGLAQSVWRVLRMVQSAAAHRFLPLATAAAARRDDAALGDVQRRSRDLAFSLLWLPLAPCLFAAGPLVRLAFGADYGGAAPALRILACGLLAPALVGYGEEVLLARDRPGRVFWLGVGAVTVTAVLLVLLAPRYGALGAAVATSSGVVLRAAAVFLLLDGPLRRATAQGVGRLALGAAPAVAVGLVTAALGVSGAWRLASVLLAATPPALLALRSGWGAGR